MAVFFSHSSSLEILRAIPPQSRLLEPVSETLDANAVVTRQKDLSSIDLSSLGIRNKPVHVLTSLSSINARTKDIVIHRCSAKDFPPNTFWRLKSHEDVYLAGPELTFIQMCTSLGELSAVILGYELCGGYSHFSQLISGFYDRKELTSTKRIDEMIGSLPVMYGKTRARRALARVLDGSRSPMETVIACMMSLSQSMGGYGILDARANFSVKLDDFAARLAGQRSCLIDLALCIGTKRIGLEYDGVDYHTDPSADRKRREALAHMGWTIYTINIDDIQDFRHFDQHIRLFIGELLPSGSKLPAEKDQRALFGGLLRITRCSLGINAALFAPVIGTTRIPVHL